MKTRLIINGKKAGQGNVRAAVDSIRERHLLEVRSTYEGGDVARMVHEALADGVNRLIAGGGDGSLHEMVDVLAALDKPQRPQMGILPLGTANDFATACGIPMNPLEALQLALEGSAVPVDIIKANEKHFINAATGGFGPEVTSSTPVELKNFLGGSAYTLTGLIKALEFLPYRGTLITEGMNQEGESLVGAICNGRMAGGGQVLAPNAYIDDGLLDIVSVGAFPAADLLQVLAEAKSLNAQGRYVKYIQASWVEFIAGERLMPVNLDGEPFSAQKIRFDVIPGAIDLVLPADCPLLKGNAN